METLKSDICNITEEEMAKLLLSNLVTAHEKLQNGLYRIHFTGNDCYEVYRIVSKPMILNLTGEEVTNLTDLLDWAHTEALTKYHIYQNAIGKPHTNSDACVLKSQDWADRAEVCRKFKLAHPEVMQKD